MRAAVVVPKALIAMATKSTTIGCASHTKRAMDILKERNNERVFLQSRTGCIEQMHCLHDLSIRLYEPQSNSHKS